MAATNNRPLSPHLQVWRWHVTMLGSILHRACLMGLYVGALILVAWAVALASGQEAYGAGERRCSLGRLSASR